MATTRLTLNEINHLQCGDVVVYNKNFDSDQVLVDYNNRQFIGEILNNQQLEVRGMRYEKSGEEFS